MRVPQQHAAGMYACRVRSILVGVLGSDAGLAMPSGSDSGLVFYACRGSILHAFGRLVHYIEELSITETVYHQNVCMIHVRIKLMESVSCGKP